MRYIGSKASILDEIKNVLEGKGVLDKNLTFCDAFCGSGAVSEYFKQFYGKIIINDNLNWATVYTAGRIVAPKCKFDNLGFDPITFLNSNSDILQGFFYTNYSPGGSERMYFTAENAGRIDYFRNKIEEWNSSRKINNEEYQYLMACLIESISRVSNTAGVYGAYLKKWDNRALKPIVFCTVDLTNEKRVKLEQHTAKIEDIIGDINCDILYLDPPYTQNQYGTQYHLLETLVLNDNPEISKVTGSRKTSPMRSDWSKDIKCHILLDKVLAETRAKYIVLSYNNDGFMTKEFIESTLKRYGKETTYACKEIPYKRYNNWKSEAKANHKEYLFFIEKKEKSNIVYESPLNYIGSKAKMIPYIRKYLDGSDKIFFDMFGGGFNVGINVPSKRVIYADINGFVTELIRSFKEYDTYEYIGFVKNTIERFGLEKGNVTAYNNARQYYNSIPIEKRDPRMLYTIILYGYQQQIRFNSRYDFNNPVGVRWFNDKILEKLISFSRELRSGNYIFKSASYLELEKEVDEQSFVYMDPPYQNTVGSYNDGKRGFKGWGSILEDELFAFIDRLSKKKVHFMLSYIIEHKGTTNKKLVEWIDANKYTLIEPPAIRGISGKERKEILVTNYAI